MLKMPRNITLLSTPWTRRIIYPLLAMVLLYVLAPHFLYAGPTNGFDLSDALIPAAAIEHGGPPRDGIPAIDEPVFITADKAEFLSDTDRVLGIDRNGVRKAYAIKILNYHEIVNDRFNEEAILVSYCPLCGTGMAFQVSTDGAVNNFGVSGLLYKSDVLLYDRKTESLWSQIMKQAVTGPKRGQHLQQIAMSHTNWGEWRKHHPDTLVLSTDTGSRRNYDRSPYAGYENSPDLYFSVGRIDSRYHPKEMVIGLSFNGTNKAYPFIELSRTGGDIQDMLAEQKLRVLYDVRNRTGQVLAADGNELPTTISYWFAWQAFHPETEVYTAP
jgi:uncharacterized protein DUF3179